MTQADTSPPEVTPPLGIDWQRAAITAVNALLAVYLLLNALMPIVWGEFPSVFSQHLRQIDELTEPVIAPTAPPDWKETYRQHQTAFLVVLAISALPVIGLLRSAYANYIGEFPPLLTTGSLILAAILILVNLLHGWGGWWGAAFLLLALGELAALYLAPLALPRIRAAAPKLFRKGVDWLRTRGRGFRQGPDVPGDSPSA